MSDGGSIDKTSERRLEVNLSQGSLATDLRLLALQCFIFVGHLLMYREERDGELTDALADVAKQDVTERCVSENDKEEHAIKFKESSYDPCVLSSVDNDDQEKELTCCNADSKPNTSGKHEAVSEKEGTFISEIRKRLCSCFDNLSFKDKHPSKNGRVEEKICPKIISFLVKTAKSTFAVAPKRTAVEKAWNNIRNLFEQNVLGLTNNSATSLVYQPSPKCCEQSSQTDTNCGTVDKGTQKDDEKTKAEKEKLEQMLTVVKQELEQLEGEMKDKEGNFKEKARELTKKNDYLETKVNELDKALKANEKELRETLLELGRLSFEHTKMIKEYKMRLEAQKNSLSQQPASQNSALQSRSRIVLGATSGAESATKHDELTENGNTGNSTNTVHAAIVPNSSNQISAFAVQVSREESSEREVISLGNIPTTTVERGLYNNYKLLILSFARSFLTSDAVALRDWVKRNHSINDAQEVVEIFWELDRKGVISASNLSPLRKFFEKIQRIDLTHLIDSFLLGDYSLLRIVNSSGVPRMSNRMTNRQTQLQSSERERLNPREEERSASGGSNSGNSREVNESFSRSGTNVQDASPKFWSTASGFTTAKDRVYQQNVQRVVATDGAPQVDGSHTDPNPASGNNGTTLSEGLSSNLRATRKLRADLGSNGQKLSKFASRDPGAHRGSNPHSPGDDPDDDDDSQWLCNHYKRRCYVKFDCCNKYWPCHRCHNNESNCGEKKLRSRDTKFIKCVRCNTEQPFTEASHNCVNCNMKLAKYFCAICKHLTGTDDNPYHCEKCGICRIHSNRSFHCDVCGVCLDVQLRGNHRCRAGSAHDECCICLEDAFTGCQILPCSHKVHKECATQMIRSGITRCPICRESFAHKLERRPPAQQKKNTGK